MKKDFNVLKILYSFEQEFFKLQLKTKGGKNY